MLVKRLVIAILILASMSASIVYAQVTLTQFNSNSTFEGASTNGVPAGWNLVISSPKVKLIPTVSTDSSRSGNKCLKLESNYVNEDQVYGLMKTDIACEPMTEYQFAFYVRSDSNDGSCWFGGGRGWNWINWIPLGTYSWRRLDAYYRTGQNETSFPFFIKAVGNSTIYVDDIKISRMGPSSDPTIRPAYQMWSNDRLQSSFSDIKLETPALRKRLEALKASGAHTDYAQIKLSMIEAFIPNVDKKINDSNLQLACTVMLDEMGLLLSSLKNDIAALTKNPKCVPAAYRYRTGKFSTNGYTQIADVYNPSTGKTTSRPAILNGFGHFFTVTDEMQYWQDRGCNFLQFQQGPDCVIPNPDSTLSVDATAINGVISKLESAAQHNIGATFLISPQYLPSRAGGPYWGDNTSVWAYYETYLAAVLPKIKNIPSLHSITLSNEPHSYAEPTDELLQNTWHQYLAKKYSNIAALNAVYGGTDYVSFSTVPMPSSDKVLPGDYTHNERPWIFDWVRCNEERFTAWHQRMADLVHKYAPNIPVHSKIIGGAIMGGPLADGIDPEMIASFSNYCGFDEVGGVRIIYDLFSSFLKAPAINSENHLITPDITYDILDGQRLYSDLFTQAMHGQTASAAWVYEPNFDELYTNTFTMRPAGMEAIARCGMDLMRIAPAMAAIQDTPRKVAIIYSPASLWYNDSHHPTWRSTWSAIFNTGLRVRFLSEKQLQAGRFDDVKVLILPEAMVVEPGTIEGIRKFVKTGGKVISIGHNLEYTLGWVPISDSKVRPLIWKRMDKVGADWEKQLSKWVNQAGVKADVKLTSSSHPTLAGIHWLSGNLNGKKVVSIANTSGKTVDISISSPKVISAWDMIQDKKIELPVKLKNYGVTTLQISVTK
ncbi:MAG: beta-galactosidase [Armatimonadota bacterium]